MWKNNSENKRNKKKQVLLMAVLLLVLAGALIYQNKSFFQSRGYMQKKQVNTNEVKEDQISVDRLEESVIQNKEAKTFEDFVYIVDNEKVIIQDYLDEADILVIPEEINGLPVIALEKSGPAWGTKVKHIVLPKGIQPMKVKPHLIITPFSCAPELEKVEVSDENLYYKSIDGVLFNKDQTVLIMYPPKKQGTSYEVPMGVLKIEARAFEHCELLEEVILPNTLIEIGELAFGSCSNLKNIDIPEGIITIEKDTFIRCSGLKEVKIPSTLTQIKNNAFGECTSLANIEVSNNNEIYKSIDGILFNKQLTMLLKYPSQKPNTKYIVPKYVKLIKSNAFEDALYLKEVILPEGLEKVEEAAFLGCDSLVSLKLPKSLKEIEDFAFSGASLNRIMIPEDVRKIGERVFADCGQLQEIQVDKSNKIYESINGVLFGKSCTTLIAYPQGKVDVKYEVPDRVRIINHYAFSKNLYLEQILIPRSVVIVGDYAFKGCVSLTTVDMQGRLIEVGKEAFDTSEGTLINYELIY